MFTRFLGGVTACLGLAGALSAGQPAPVGTPSAAAPAAFPTRAVTTQLPAAAPTTLPQGTAPLGTPAADPLMLGAQHPAYAADPAAGPCGTDACLPAKACGTACDCLCGPPGRLWVSAEYLYWVAKGQNTPAFVTSSPAGTPRGTAGVLGAPGTSTLFGGDKLNDNFRNGLRVRAGAWLDDCQRFGVEGDFFFLGNSGQGFTATSNGSQILARPFVDALGNRANSQLVAFGGNSDSQLVAFPGVLAGSVGVRSSSDFIGGGLGLICNLCCDPCGRLDFVYGFRYLGLRDDITINENLTALAGSNVPAGTQFLIQDRIRTTNNFYGANVGFNYERRFGHFFLGVRPTVALGVVHTNVDITGNTTIVTPAGVATNFPGGLLTQTSNIGSYSSNQFSVAPEIGVRAGVQVTEHLRAFVSYNFIAITNVARAGDQFDTRVNTNQIAPASGGGGPALPAFQLHRSTYHVQGIGAGLELRY